MPQGKVAVNPAAWLRYRRCSRILEASAAASVSADGAGQLGGVGDGDRDVQADQADPGAAGFLVGGLPGAGLVVGVAGGDVAAGAAGVLAAELRGPDLAVQGAGGRGGGQRPVLQADPLRVGARAEQAGQDVGGDVLPGRLPPGPADRGAAVVLVAVPAFLGTGRARAGPVQLLFQRGADPGGEQPADLAAHRGVERGADHPGDVGGAGAAEHGDPAGAEG